MESKKLDKEHLRSWLIEFAKVFLKQGLPVIILALTFKWLEGQL